MASPLARAALGDWRRCERCNITFATKRALINHQTSRRHLGPEALNFACKICSKRFARDSDRQRHERTRQCEYTFKSAEPRTAQNSPDQSTVDKCSAADDESRIRFFLTGWELKIDSVKKNSLTGERMFPKSDNETTVIAESRDCVPLSTLGDVVKAALEAWSRGTSMSPPNIILTPTKDLSRCGNTYRNDELSETAKPRSFIEDRSVIDLDREIVACKASPSSFIPTESDLAGHSRHLDGVSSASLMTTHEALGGRLEEEVEKYKRRLKENEDMFALLNLDTYKMDLNEPGGSEP